MSSEWFDFYKSWIDNYDGRQLHLLFYENLKRNMQSELYALSEFLVLKFGVTEELCIKSLKDNPIIKRRHMIQFMYKHLYNDNMTLTINNSIDELRKIVHKKIPHKSYTLKSYQIH